MSKEPSPKADKLREQREQRRGHLQATVTEPTPAPAKKKRALIPFAGKPKMGYRADAPGVRHGGRPKKGAKGG